MADAAAKVLLAGEEVEIPPELLEDREVFSHVLSVETWRTALSEEERGHLANLLPPSHSQDQEQLISQLFSGEDFRFGSPLERVWMKLSRGELFPGVHEAQQQLRELKYQQYEYNMKRYYVKLLQELLITRQELMQSALHAGPLENIPKKPMNGHKRKSALERKAEIKYRRILEECRRESGQERASSDEEEELPPNPTNQNAAETEIHPITEEHYRRMLRKHRQRRLLKKTDPDLVTSGLNLAKVTQRQEDKKNVAVVVPEEPQPCEPAAKKRKTEGEFPSPFAGRDDRLVGVGTSGYQYDEEYALLNPNAEAQAVYDVYKPIESGSRKEPPLEPFILRGPLPQGRFMSFFSVLRHVFEPLHDQKGELNKITKSVRTVMRSLDCANCSWLRARTDWTELTLSAMGYLAAEVGAMSSFDPLPHFIPLLEFRDRIDHWKWIGHGRDSDFELLVLCNHWLDNIDRALSIVDYSDYDPPPPHVWTHYIFRQSTPEEVASFRELERERYENPHKAFNYNVHGFESPVGPVKGVRTSKKDSGGSRARGHALLVPERPNCVTILSLVRDATSRLPNGEGTRIDLCVLVRDSQYLQETISETQLNNAVSGALDRLHYEKDPCVRYDSTRKVWIYLHRGRTEEDFERIHWACEVASQQRKKLMIRTKIKPKIIVKMPDGKEVTVEEGGEITTPTNTEASSTGTAKKQTGKSSQTSLGNGAPTPKTTAVIATTTASASTGTSVVVVASIVQRNPEQSPIPPPTTGKQPPTAQKTATATTTQKSSSQQTLGGTPKQATITPISVVSSAQQPSSLEPQKKKKKDPSRAHKLTASTFQESDWESSEEEMPFLDSSLLPGSRVSSKGSTSSWQSSESEDNNLNISATPNFLANISMESELGERFQASGSEGESFDFQKGPPAWLADSSSNSD